MRLFDVRRGEKDSLLDTNTREFLICHILDATLFYVIRFRCGEKKHFGEKGVNYFFWRIYPSSTYLFLCLSST